MNIQKFAKVTETCHPAVPFALAYLEGIAKKDMTTFKDSLDEISTPFFANLPGAVKVEDPKRFISMHKEFFESPVSRFEYGPLEHGVGGSDFFHCSVPAKVVLPNGSKRDVYIDMTLYKHHDSWFPGRFINTVVDASQVVLPA